MLAWIGVLLDWRPLRSVQTSDGGLRFDFERGGASRGREPGPADGPCGKSGILGLELLARASATPSGARRWIRQWWRRRASPRSLSCWTRTPTPSCAWRRWARGRDPLFARCLAYARQLWSLEPDSAGSRR